MHPARAGAGQPDSAPSLKMQGSGALCLLAGNLGKRSSSSGVQVLFDACMLIQLPGAGAGSTRKPSWGTETVTVDVLAVPHTCRVPGHAAPASPGPMATLAQPPEGSGAH